MGHPGKVPYLDKGLERQNGGIRGPKTSNPRGQKSADRFYPRMCQTRLVSDGDEIGNQNIRRRA